MILGGGVFNGFICVYRGKVFEGLGLGVVVIGGLRVLIIMRIVDRFL